MAIIKEVLMKLYSLNKSKVGINSAAMEEKKGLLTFDPPFTAAEVDVDAAGFNGNLAPTDNTVQKVAQKFDDFVAGGGGTGLTTFLTPTNVANPDVASGNAVDIWSITLGAGAITDGSRMIIDTFVTAFTSDGVPTLREVMNLDDGVLPLSTQLQAADIMPNNVVKYAQILGWLIRIGTHLYLSYAVPRDTIGSGAYAPFLYGFSGGFDISAYQDLGEPNFANAITIKYNVQLSAPQVGAIYKVLNSEARLLKTA